MRSTHLTEAFTSRDIFGVVRGACRSCTACGGYWKATADYTIPATSIGRKHPDNDVTVSNCTRCSCPPEAHAVDEVPMARALKLDGESSGSLLTSSAPCAAAAQAAHERELGNDAYALGQHDAAVLHYTRALAARPRPDAALHSNRAAAYLAKRWWPQALADADAALALRPDWGKAHGRRAAALAGMGRHADAAHACREGLRHEPSSAALQSTLRSAERALAAQARPRGQAVEPGQRQEGAIAGGSARTAAAAQPQQPPPAAREPQAAAGEEVAGEAGLRQVWETCRGMQETLGHLSSAVSSMQAQLGSMDAALAGLRRLQPTCPGGTEREPGSGLPGEEQGLPAVPLQRVASVSSEQGPGSTPASEDSSFELLDVSPQGSPQHGSAAASLAADAGPNVEARQESAESSEVPRNLGPDQEQQQACGGCSEGSPSPDSSSGAASVASGEEEEGGASSDCDDAGWLAGVYEARRRLAPEGGRIQPPARCRPAMVRPEPGPGPAAGYAAAAGAPAAAAPPAVRLTDLQNLFAGAAVCTKDPGGVARVACKACAPPACPQFAATRQEHPPGAELTYESFQRSTQLRGLCSACGCSAGEHETGEEAAAREARDRRAQRRQEARRAAVGGHGPAASAAGPEPPAARRARVAAAAARARQAAAEGELLQESDADVLTHSRRVGCSACSDCPGFCIQYRSCDASDPEVMFFCSLCGCRAEAHAPDPAWQAAEARRVAEEAAARAAQQRSAAQQPAVPPALAALAREREALAVLGLPPGAAPKAVARAYKRLALATHPDKQAPGDGAEAAAAAAERFYRVTEAYKLLCLR